MPRASTTPFAALRSQHPMLATPSTTPFAALRASKFERSPREMLCASLSLILASRGRAQCRLRTRVGLCRSVGHLSATELQLQLGYTYSYWGDSLVPHGSAFQTRTVRCGEMTDMSSYSGTARFGASIAE